MHTAETVTFTRLSSGIPVRTTVHTCKPADGTDGSTLYVRVVQYGWEIDGTEVFRRFHGHLERAEPLGRVITVSVVDPLTFDRVSYVIPEVLDPANSNMNRVWPGDPDGSLYQHIAVVLWKYISDADAIVDLYTGSPDVLTHTIYFQGDEESRDLARAFGVDILLVEAVGDEVDDEWTERSFDGKLRVAVTNAGIPSITPELTHNKQLVEPAIVAGVEGVLNVYHDMGILPGAAEPWDGRTYRNHLGRVQAAASGLFAARENVELVREVRPGDHPGWVYGPTTYEVLQEVEAERVGLVYSIIREATATAGETLIGVVLLPDDGEGDDEEDDPFDEADGDFDI